MLNVSWVVMNSAIFRNSPAINDLVYPGLVNPQGGLRLYRDAVITRLLAGGVQINGIGDSICKGSGSTNYLARGWLRMLNYMLQTALNPTGVGGAGWIPASDSSSTYGGLDLGTSDPYRVSLLSTAAANMVYTDNGDGIGARRVLIDNDGAADAQRFIYFAFDNSATNRPSMNDAYDEFQIMYGTDPAYGTITYDQSAASGATPARGTGTPTGTIATNTAASFGNQSDMIAVSNAFADSRLILRPDTLSTLQVDINGVYFTKGGGSRKGIMVNDLSNAGSRLYDWSANAISASITKTSAGYNSSGYRQGMVNAGLFIISDVINVALAVGTGEGLGKYKDAWMTTLDAIRNGATRPGALAIIPPKPTNITTAVSNAFDAVAAEWKGLARGAYSDILTTLDFRFYRGLETAAYSDNIHPDDTQHVRILDVLGGLLTEAVRI